MGKWLKIAVCRCLFVSLALLPVLGTLGYAGWQHWQVTESSAAGWINTHLGARAELKKRRLMGPGVERCRSLRLMDPEDGRLLSQVRELEMRAGDALLWIGCSSFELPAAAISDWWKILHDRVLRHPELFQRPIRMQIDRCAIRRANEELELQGLRIELANSPGGTECRISFRAPGDLASRTVRMHVSRELHDSHVVTRFDVSSPDQALDCGLFASAIWPEYFGEHVMFRGMASCELHPNGWRGEISAGQLSGLDLAAMSAVEMIPPMTGQVTADIRAARWKRDRLVSADVVIAGNEGSIAPQVIQRAERLGLSVDALDQLGSFTLDGNLRYNRLGLRLLLDETGYRLAGTLSQRGAVLQDGDAVLLSGVVQDAQPNARLLEWITGQPVPDALFTRWGAAAYARMPLKDGL